MQIVEEETRALVLESWADMLAATSTMKKDQRIAGLDDEVAAKLAPGATAENSFVQFAIQYSKLAAKEWNDPSQKLNKKQLKQIDEFLSTPGLVKQTAHHIKAVCEKKQQYTEEPWNKIPVLKEILDSSEFGEHFAAIMAEYIGDVLLDDCRWVDVNDPGF